jgi:hypothetical protein
MGKIAEGENRAGAGVYLDLSEDLLLVLVEICCFPVNQSDGHRFLSSRL